MAILTFEDLYLSVCENCGADLDNWDWFEEGLYFKTTCICCREYTLEPTMAVLCCEPDDEEDEEDDE